MYSQVIAAHPECAHIMTTLMPALKDKTAVDIKAFKARLFPYMRTGVTLRTFLNFINLEIQHPSNYVVLYRALYPFLDHKDPLVFHSRARLLVGLMPADTVEDTQRFVQEWQLANQVFELRDEEETIHARVRAKAQREKDQKRDEAQAKTLREAREKAAEEQREALDKLRVELTTQHAEALRKAREEAGSGDADAEAGAATATDEGGAPAGDDAAEVTSGEAADGDAGPVEPSTAAASDPPPAPEGAGGATAADEPAPAGPSQEMMGLASGFDRAPRRRF
jgi:hypothetical protein